MFNFAIFLTDLSADLAAAILALANFLAAGDFAALRAFLAALRVALAALTAFGSLAFDFLANDFLTVLRAAFAFLRAALAAFLAAGVFAFLRAILAALAARIPRRFRQD